MKVAVLLATYNKQACLPNTLKSISAQETDHEIQVVVVDDGSLIDPKPIVDQFYPGAVYKRFKDRISFVFSQGHGMQLMDTDTDVVVIQSCDVMYMTPKVIDALVSRVAPDVFTLAHVRNVPVDGIECFGPEPVDGRWRFNTPGMNELFNRWNLTTGTNIYSGSLRPSGDWLFFLGAIRMDDAFRIGFHQNGCDVVVQHRLKELKFRPVFMDDVPATHQHHPWAHKWPCPILSSCEYHCSRKS